ncbi:signal peptide peptidase SppA [Desulfovibrio inopinatus]|uniref:signal peptide peptidase SppA n=1 Tax=Desulfovibrio inopinatus TaxID=102109 RepID=UPI00041868A7|nr:signal peptide peptidase SppA [Desulfovibrio inopinatus]
MILRAPLCCALTALLALLLLSVGCTINVDVFGKASDPLKEYVLEGSGSNKVLIIPIRGFLSESPREGLVSQRPGVVQTVSSILHKAAQDDSIKAVVLLVNSPGGTVTAADIIYHELMRFRSDHDVLMVACIMSVGASGGYYVSMAADTIVAHPTSIVGSVGTIFITPKVQGLMDKLGVGAEVTKSGKLKDMGTPFRESTPEEQKLVQSMIDTLNSRFLELVKKRRHVSESALADIAQAGVYTASQAKRNGLIDTIGYMDDAIELATTKANLDDDPKVIIYRRNKIHDDTYFNPSSSNANASLIDLGTIGTAIGLETGLYHLWMPGSRP